MAQPNASNISANVKLNEQREVDIENQIICKTCPKKFPTLQACLLHELTHLNFTENKTQKNENKRKKRKNTKRLIRTLETVEEREFKTLVKTALSFCDVGTELNILCRLFQPDPDNLSCIYDRIYFDLEQDLCKIGNWNIQPFGSTVTGMAFKSSDMDFYIENLNTENHDKKLLFKKVVRQLRKSKNFSRIIPIDKARVPIIKCTHSATGYDLDVNLTSKFGVYNSQFIAKVLNFDTRIHPLMLLIKIWAKSWHITKSGRMSNYCLTWIVFFYLQNCKPSILPSIKQFQTGAFKRMVGDINFAFNDTIKNELLNNANIKDLVEGFFHFYANFEFENFIICPYLGQAIKKSDFQNKTFVYTDYIAYMKLLNESTDTISYNVHELQPNDLNINTSMVVQDPFCLNLNKADTVREPVFNLFKAQITAANTIFSEKEQSSSALLIKLFYDEPTSKIIPEMPKKEPPVTKNTSNAATFVCRMCAVENELLYVRTYLRKAFPNQIFDKTDVNKFWVEKIIEFTFEILQNIFKITVTFVQESPAKSARIDGQSDVYNNKYYHSVELQAAIDFWTSRKNEIKKGYAAFLQEQIEITKKFENERKENFQCNLNCRLDIKPDFDYSAITINMQDLIPKNGKSNFKSFCSEYTARMRNLYKAYFESLVRSI